MDVISIRSGRHADVAPNHLPISAKRLRERMDEIGRTQEDLAIAVGATQGAISQILTGATRNSRLMPRIAENLAINLNWLIGATDERIDMLDADGELISEDTLAAIKAGISSKELKSPKQLLARSGSERHQDAYAVENEVMLPQLEIGYSMGGGSVFADYAQTAMIPFPREWIRPMIRGTFSDLFVARGDGDSMMPTLLDGDVVIIDTSQKTITQQDRLWCLSYGDLGMIKRVRVQPDGGILIISDNPAVENFTAYDQEVHTIGRVIWIGRRV